MKEKILVRIVFAMADLQYDFRLPCDVAVQQITNTLVPMIREMSVNKLTFLAQPLLWSARTGKPLSLNKTLREQEISDSDMLYLI